MKERILPLLSPAWHRELTYFIEDEFKNKIMIEGAVRFVSTDEISEKFNEDRFSPIDGDIIKACDHLAAYMEAALSVSHGITSNHLESVLKSLPEAYASVTIAGIDFDKIYKGLN